MKANRNGSTRKRRGESGVKSRGKKGDLLSLQHRCERLEQDKRRLRRQVDEIGAKCDLYRRALSTVLSRDAERYNLDWENVSAQIVKKPSLEDFLAELEAKAEAWEKTDP